MNTGKLKLVKSKIINKENFQFENSTYYLVEASFNANNPVCQYILFSGFVDHHNIPQGYNSIIMHGSKIAEYSELWYLEVVKKLVTL